MGSSLITPICIVCKRGSKYNLAGRTETFILARAEVRRNHLYQGAKWHVFCGSCIRPYLYDPTIDGSNLMPLILQINIKGKGRNQTRKIEVLF